MQKMRQRDYFQTSFYFKKNAKYEINKMICNLVSIYFDSPRLHIQ